MGRLRQFVRLGDICGDVFAKARQRKPDDDSWQMMWPNIPGRTVWLCCASARRQRDNSDFCEFRSGDRGGFESGTFLTSIQRKDP
jgi:hypothetical protein